MPEVYTRETVRGLVGQELGVSDWFEVTQEMVNEFADLTHDHQFIHVDPEKAAKTPLGGTIAHGFLTLSLLGGMVEVAQVFIKGATMGFNYGMDQLRFLSPVPTGSRIRGRFVLVSVDERKPGQFLLTMAVTVEIEGSERPALSVQWHTLIHATG